MTRPAPRPFRLLALLMTVAACGGRTIPEIPEGFASDEGVRGERCNGLDDDGDGEVDEAFVNGEGRYVHDDHCGRCGAACDDPVDYATGTACVLIGDSPVCGATACEEGYQLTRGARCAPTDDFVCMPCLRDQDCGPLDGARCVDIGGESRCTRDCYDGCPDGYTCAEDLCLPFSKSCLCTAETEQSFSFACEVIPGCVGSAECIEGVATECTAGEELCGGGDEDCDGEIDEGFVDERGVYSLDPRHCGACGRDCTLDEGAALPLACGGDPFAPSCVIACPDAADGIQVGDRLDADGNLDNGCECRVRGLIDPIGSALGDDIVDDNCDGADGDVLGSYYVATTGDDLGPGSPTRPLATINEAIRRASDSRGSGMPRLDVFVAGGVYVETIELLDGVRVHGGYRTDYLKRDTGGYEVIVVGVGDGELTGGPALIALGAGFSPTLIEGLELRGRDATKAAEAAIGAVLLETGDQLTLRDLRIRAGRPGAGASGGDGSAGQGPMSEPESGGKPRAAEETEAHECAPGNAIFGGDGGHNVCGGLAVSGGRGGSAVCPVYGNTAMSGQAGFGFGVGSGGPGGPGGVDLQGPITNSPSCPSAVCCGLADFSVPGTSFLATPGSPGLDGASGTPGAACTTPSGTFTVNGNWFSIDAARPGTSGSAGGGGGGGGAGGGARIVWFDGACEFADGLGGGGGGGGAGGCGGAGGEAGQSGGPSIAVLVVLDAQRRLPIIEDCTLSTQDGGDGGDGGNGGDGGPGGSGAFGGWLASEERTTPSLAGPSGGERGGKGGDGGPGGGGGGGCGGNAVGIWIAGTGGSALDPTPFAGGNTFELGAAGEPGAGGGGPIPAQDGAAGQRLAVLIQ